MSEDPADDPMPLVSLTAMTEQYDLQTSLIDDLLGETLDLGAAGAGAELAAVAVDPALVIHPNQGTAQVQLGWTREQVEDSLGPPDSVYGGTFEELDLTFGVTLNYTQRGLEVKFHDDVVSSLTFHSGRYSGGLIAIKFDPYAGVAHPDLDLATVTEADLRARLGEPSQVIDAMPDLAELLDERPTHELRYPGWEWKLYDDGTVESVSVPRYVVIR